MITDIVELNRQLEAAIKAKEKAELIAMQATSELGLCFLKYQQTCDAYNELKRTKLWAVAVY